MRPLAALLGALLPACTAPQPAATPEAPPIAEAATARADLAAHPVNPPCETPLSAELAERARSDPPDRFHVGRVAPAPPAKASDERTDTAELADGALADVLLEAGRWTEVIPVLRRVAYDDPSPTGAVAAVRYLEALSRVAVVAERRSCTDRVFHDAPELAARHCRGNPDGDRRAPCSVLLRAEIGIERRQIERTVEEADRRDVDERPFDEPGSRAALYDRAATSYADLAERCCVATKRVGTDPREWRCDEMAFNAVRSFRAARRLDRADDAETWMLRSACGLGRTPLADRLREDRKAGRRTAPRP